VVLITQAIHSMKRMDAMDAKHNPIKEMLFGLYS
jgi:hypothetical protein